MSKLCLHSYQCKGVDIMISIKLGAILGDTYNVEDQVTDTVERICGARLQDKDGFIYVYEVGHAYNDGKIVDVFVHPESDCIWFIVECNGIYFEMHVDGFVTYIPYYEPLPWEYYDPLPWDDGIKDSTKLSGGHLW